MNATELAELRIAAARALKDAIGRGMDAAHIASEIGKKPEAIGRYLAGQNLPTPKTARRILKVCGE